jgi:hypothetical protein
MINYGKTTYLERFKSDYGVITKKLYTGKVKKIIKGIINALNENLLKVSGHDTEENKDQVRFIILI